MFSDLKSALDYISCLIKRGIIDAQGNRFKMSFSGINEYTADQLANAGKVKFHYKEKICEVLAQAEQNH